MANHVSKLGKNWVSEKLSSVKSFLLYRSYLLTSLSEIQYRKSRHTSNHMSEIREHWFSESISRLKFFLTYLSYFLISLGEIW